MADDERPRRPAEDPADTLPLAKPKAPDGPAAPRRRPLAPGERVRLAHISAQRDIRGRLIGLAIVLGVVAGIGGLVYWRVAAFTARHRVEALLHQVARGEDVLAAVQELGRRLPLVVAHCNRLFEQDKPTKERLHLLNGLTAALSRLDEEVDLTPLLDLTDRAPAARRRAMSLVRARRGRDWLLERTCDGSPAARHFAVEALRPVFPLGELTDAEAQTLARPTSLAEKRSLFNQVYRTVHRRLEERWTGRYRLRLDAVWKMPNVGSTEHHATTEAAPVEIACQDRTWRVTLLGKTWTGTVDELPRLRLSCPVVRLAEPALAAAPFHHIGAASLTIEFRERFVATVHPVPRFRPLSRGTTPLDEKGRIPPGASVVGQAVGQKLGLPAPVFVWVLPPRPGFEKLQARLVKAP